VAQQEDPKGNGSVSSEPQPIAPMVPVSAEDFARGKRRIILACVAAALLVALAALWIFRRSVDPLDAQRALEEGRRLLKASRYSEAILAFDHALALKGDLADAYVLRGRANLALTRLEPAIQDFTAVIRLRPGSAEPFVDRALAHLGQENYAAVIADCGEALKRDSKLAPAYNLRGMALRQTGNVPQALEDLNRAVEIAPDESNYFQRGATYQLMGEHRLAITDLDQVIALIPSSPMGYLARAKSRAALGDLAGARSDREAGRLLEGREPGH
jgi:tetratricopeptide (TPR) repeat protein